MQAAEELTKITPDGIRDAVEQLRITDEIVRDSSDFGGGPVERGTRNAERGTFRREERGRGTRNAGSEDAPKLTGAVGFPF